MVMVDDATGLTHAKFFEAETTGAVMSLLRGWVDQYGLPRALYPDRHSIHRRNDPQAHEQEQRTGHRPPTRFGEALAELGVELIWAHSPQAKGRVERMNKTLQDRLVKLLALEKITTIAAANAYLEAKFLPAHNARFAVVADDDQDAHRPAPSAAELDAALCPVRERRQVARDATVSWRGRCLQLRGPGGPGGPDATVRRRRQVQVRQRLDGLVELLDVSTLRLLEHRELAQRPSSQKLPKPPLPQRVAALPGPSKPAANHPWRSDSTLGGSAAVRCAHLRCTPQRGSPKGTVLLG